MQESNVVDGNLLILASAGSGKTYQLGNRVIGRVARGVPPEQIVALTFTRKAAGEFADSVLGKLADAVVDATKARDLAHDLGTATQDFDPVLRTIVRALPRFTLTTIDSFFTRVVRGFQYELGLTGGRFDLLEGPRAAAARDDLLGDLLGRALDDGRASDFTIAFRRAIAGREKVGVANGLRDFVEAWHRRFANASRCVWGPDFLVETADGEWEKQRHQLADQARDACRGIEETRKGQLEQLHKFIDRLEAYELASGKFPAGSKLADGILAAVVEGHAGDLELQYYKPFILPANALRAIAGLVRLAAQAEMAAAVARTRAIEAVVAGYDALAEARLRRRGLLGFDDVKRLMGEWSQSEDARLRRELVDFRLDARYEHWLLDEFQDTSREEWTGLVPLLDEAVAEGEGSLFIVGDRKQAIYGWRGGDVTLFDEVEARFGDGIQSRPMAESWRSCPQVLGLVNRVCGDTTTIGHLFGIGPDRWRWDVHESAKPLQAPGKAGEARVELIDLSAESDPAATSPEDDEEAAIDDPRLIRMVGQMHELGIGRKDLTCGVLVRRNSDARVVADALRGAGFDVVVDGVREPARDHPAGVAAWQLLRWLANPDDEYARRVLEMTPLGTHLMASMDGQAWFSIWERLHGMARQMGFAGMVAHWLRPLASGMSDYGRRRLDEVLDALAAFDASPDVGARAAAQWLERLEVPQNPGAAAVQVMTIHKSKGLGFDVVFLPMLPDRRIPEAQRFTVACGDGWLCGVPPGWARPFFPEILTAERRWAAGEAYEALCQLYVALTRAKRGLYVYLGKKKSAGTESPTLTNWMLQSLQADATPGVIYQSGDAHWAESTAPRRQAAARSLNATLGAAIAKRARQTPSGAHEADAEPTPPATSTESPDARRRASASGMRFGSEVHACLEQIEWLGAGPPPLPDHAAGRLVASLLNIPEIAKCFTRPASGFVSVHREQPVDAIIHDRWITGIIDRMHVHRHQPDGTVALLEIIDFKTDAVTDAATLIARHTRQMQAYRAIVSGIYPQALITTTLISTSLQTTIPIP